MLPVGRRVNKTEAKWLRDPKVDPDGEMKDTSFL